jgi:hypothetical protein
MFINKTGSYHLEYGLNNQDYGFNAESRFNTRFKLVVDGCSEGQHSEVGAKLFCHDIKRDSNYFNLILSPDKTVSNVFTRILKFFGAVRVVSTIVKDYLCFTVLYVVENEFDFIVGYCGDGYIITEALDGTIKFNKIDNGDFPEYFAYRYITKEKLPESHRDVRFKTLSFSKSQYKNVGVATDGLRFIFDQEFYDEFADYLKLDKESAIKRLINRESKIFKDDITIAF